MIVPVSRPEHAQLTEGLRYSRYKTGFEGSKPL